MSREVVLYGRPGCHLCDDARNALQRVRAALGDVFELTEVDITTDDRLHARYLERIPVVVLDGEEIFDYVVDEPEMRARLLRTVS